MDARGNGKNKDGINSHVDPPKKPVLDPRFSRIWLPIAYINHALNARVVTRVYNTNFVTFFQSPVSWLYFFSAPLIALLVGLVMIPLAGAIMTPSLITFLRQSGWGWPRILIVLLLRACWLPQPLVAILIGRRSRLSSRWSFIVGMFGVILFITGFCLIDPRAHGVLTWSQLFILGLLSLAASFLHIAAGLLYRQMRELSPAGGTSSFTTLTIK